MDVPEGGLADSSYRGVFLSYRRDDSAGHAGRLADTLVQRFGPSRVFFDVGSIELGRDFLAATTEALARCSVVLALIGPRWLDARTAAGTRRLDDPDDYVRRELEVALAHGVRLIPVLHSGCTMPVADDLPPSLRTLVRCNAFELIDRLWNESSQMLVDALAASIAPGTRDSVDSQRLVTVLFTDIEGSTRLWEERPDAMRIALARHDELVRAAIERHGGHVFKMVGDAFHAVFVSAVDAMGAAIAAQQVLGVEPWPEGARIRARMALHSGEVSERDGDYVGPMLNRLSRMLATAHGGQLLLSDAVASLVREDLPAEVSLLDLGEHRLRDLALPQRLFQVRGPDLAEEFGALRSLEDPGLPNNLPAQVTSFVGRARELVELRDLLDGARVVTVTGAGGVGKTRLALQAGAELLDGSGDGVWLVELAPLAAPDLVAKTVASVLQVREEPGRPALETLVDALHEKALLIVLDNCEHVLDAVAKLAERLVQTCPGVEILATSREPLGIAGEHVYRIPSLSLPPADARLDLASLADYEAVQLFAERALYHRPGFALDPTNADAVVSVCTHLDGIPLAIELAAARLRSLSIGEIEQRLDQRFRLLRGGNRTALPRQQTLAALVGWSYDLLNEHERAALCRLAVFAGGWDLDAAEAVVADGELIEASEVVDLLGALVDKSLVQAEPRGYSTRYRMLETIRQYATEELTRHGDNESRQAHLRHRDHYLAVAERAAPELFGVGQTIWYERLGLEHDNLRAALATTGQDPDGASKGFRLVAALSNFWGRRGLAPEGVEQASLALARPDATAPTGQRAAALVALADLRLDLGEYTAGVEAVDEALAIARALDEPDLTADTLWTLAYSMFLRGDLEAARQTSEQALSQARRGGDPHRIGGCLNLLAHVAFEAGDPGVARPLYQEALVVRRAEGNDVAANEVLGNLALVEIVDGNLDTAGILLEESAANLRGLCDEWGLAVTISNLGAVAIHQHDADAALRNFTEALGLALRYGMQFLVACGLLGFALIATLRHEFERAAVLHGAADHLVADVGGVFHRIETELRVADITRLRDTLGDDTFDTAYRAGCALSRGDAVDFALAT